MLIEMAKKRPAINLDETTIQVMNEEGRKNTSISTAIPWDLDSWCFWPKMGENTRLYGLIRDLRRKGSSHKLALP
jgi:hypothetical protein